MRVGTPVDMMPEENVSSLIGRLVGEARGVANAEVALVKAKVGGRVAAYKGAAILFGVAGILALAGLIAMLVGLIFTLATLVGPGFATLIVVGVTFAIAGLLAIIGKGRLATPKLEDVA